MTSCLAPAPAPAPVPPLVPRSRWCDSGRKTANHALGLPPLFRDSTALHARRLGRSGIALRTRKSWRGSAVSVSASLGPGLADAVNYASSYDVQNAVLALQAQLIKLASEAGIENLQTEHDSARLTAYVLLFSYIFAPPGGLWGVVDFLYSPIHSLTHRTYNAEDIKVGRQMGEGSYGVVYEGLIMTGKSENDEGIRVILKRMKNNVTCASEMHDVELYMNRRLQRTSPGTCAEFLGTVDVKPENAKGKLHQGIWLVWKFEGALTLEHYLKQRSFPDKIADILISNEEKLKFNAKSNQKSREELIDYELIVVRKIMKQLLCCLQNIHSTGIIHRDIKPSNLIVTEDGKIKLLDLGACVDLRTGFNYVPNETVMDPKYAPPERYVMPPASSLPFPPDPLSTLLSPLVWALNTPDRFDLYSAGVVLLQLSIKHLRHDSALENFNLDLKNCDYDLNAWRKKCRFHENDFALLDANGKAGWELACSLLQPRKDYKNYIWPSLGESRPTAAAALRHRFFHTPFTISIPFSVPDLSSPAPVFAYAPTSTSFLPDIAQITSHLANFVNVSPNTDSPPKEHVVEKLSNRKGKDEAKINMKKNDALPGFPSHDLVFHSLQDHVHHVIEQTSPIRNALNDVVVPKKNPVPTPSPIPISKHNHIEKPSKNSANKNSEPPRHTPFSQSNSKQVEDRKMKVTEIEITSVNLMQEIKSLIPTAASLALPLALIYAGLDSLRSYVSTTYDMGKSTMEAVGPVVGNTSLLIAFIYVSRLWLKQQRIKSIRANRNSEPLSSSNSSIPITSASSRTHASPSSSSPSLEDFQDLTFVLPKEMKKDVEVFEDGKQEIGVVMEWPSSPGEHFNFLNRKFDLDQSESMVVKELEAMEKQMESLERCMLSERTFALQQTRLLTKMESMVLNPAPNSNLNGIASMSLHDVGVGGHVLNTSTSEKKDGSNDNSKDKSLASLDN